LLRIEDPAGAVLLRVPQPSQVADRLREFTADSGSPRGTA
jgi:hypothetical protein